MKKYIKFFLLLLAVFFCCSSLGYSQITIRSLSAISGTGFADDDLLLVSLNSPLGTLRNLSYTNLRSNLSGETYTWSGINTYSNRLVVSGGGRFVLQSLQSGSFSGELTYTSGYNYLRFNGASTDTVMTHRQMYLNTNTFYGASVFSGNTTLANVSVNDTVSVGGDGYIKFNSGRLSFVPQSIEQSTGTLDLIENVDGTFLSNVLIIKSASQGSQTITSITDGTNGMLLYLCGDLTGQDQDIIVQDNASINLGNAGGNRTISQGDVLVLLFCQSEWFEVSFSDN